MIIYSKSDFKMLFMKFLLLLLPAKSDLNFHIVEASQDTEQNEE